ncbi:HAD family hydrolase [Coleofasciculus sp. E1-EBD-02]|uniref:HAD family hydrolase n=1 Tax=Coleofasciculus sp. E1-EBD-02 TaxID=3068481 RepID=UPI0032F57D87
MIKTIILDLDGPIINSQLRHYTCYSQFLEKYGYIPVTLEKYWQMKRNCVDIRQQLEVSGAAEIHQEFLEAWLKHIENPDMLRLDCLQLGVLDKLQEWRFQELNLVLATMRRSSNNLNQQLINLGLDTWFDSVAVCEHNLGGKGKVQKVKQLVADISPTNVIWIGDSEIDIQAARFFGCPIWAVTCGIRSEAVLASWSPDFISPALTQVDLRYCREH